MTKFSVILPVKNGGNYVKECIASILNQTYKHFFNVIVLDNNSDDGTMEWLQTLKDSRVSIFPSRVSLSMEDNWGRIKFIPKNEFMTIIGHDDILLPSYLDEMNQLISRFPEASLYQTHFDFIDENGKYLRTAQPMNEIQYADDFIKCQILKTLDSTGTGYMFRSSDYDRLGGIPCDYPNLIFADYALWVMLTSISYKATSVNKCFNYRLHNSTSRLTNGMLYCQAFEKYIYFLASVSKENNEVKFVIDQYGKKFLLDYCESLSHRLLKTPFSKRQMKVADFIEKCNLYAESLIPNVEFLPKRNFKILIAEVLDSNIISRKLFVFFRQII